MPLLHFVLHVELLWSVKTAVQSLFIIRQKNVTCATHVGIKFQKK